MTHAHGTDRHSAGLLNIEPEALSHQELIDLVRDLQRALAGQEQLTEAERAARAAKSWMERVQ